jgi:RNA polymerase-binding protein DksA
MTAKELENFKNILLEKRWELLRREGLLKSDGNTEFDLQKETDDSRYTTHLADQGSDAMGREQVSYFKSRIRKYLHHLDEALLRIENGEFGICIGCGEEIPKERLEAVPHTRYCIPCKSQKDNKDKEVEA